LAAATVFTGNASFSISSQAVKPFPDLSFRHSSRLAHQILYRLARWSILHKPKSLGALGTIDLGIQNKGLLSKWIFKLANEEGFSQDMLKKKYFKEMTLSQVVIKKGDSQFWLGLMEVKSFVMERGRSKVHDSGRIYGLVMHN
jgi:hypothetical protein